MAFITEEEKQSLLDRYFDIEWNDDVSDLRCVRCHRVAIKHYVSTCQHLFCKKCSNFYNVEEQLKCPQCQETITQPDKTDFYVEVKIHRMKIFCPNNKYGCKYSDQLRRMPSHLMTCINRREAAHSVDSQVKVISLNAIIEDLREKTREVNKKVDDKFNQLEKQTEDIDRQLNVLTERMTSLDKKAEGMHLESRKYAEELRSIKSLLESINHQQFHQSVQKNEALVQPTSSNMEMASNTRHMEEHLAKESEELNPLKARPYEIRFKVLNTNQSVTWIYETKPIMPTGYRYQMRVKFAKEEGEICMSLQFKDGDTVNQFSQIHRFTKVKYIVCDLCNDQNKKDTTRELELSFDDCFGNDEWIMGRVIAEGVLAPPYMKDDAIRINLLFEPASIDRSFVSTNGVLLWRVDNIQTKKEEYLYNDVYSPTFYTSPHGYRVRIRLLLNHSSSMQVEVNFLTGEHDASLTRHFSHMTTVTLINQNDPSKNVVKCKQREDVKCYTISFYTSKLVKKKGFNDDSIFFKVVIEPLTSN